MLLLGITLLIRDSSSVSWMIWLISMMVTISIDPNWLWYIFSGLQVRTCLWLVVTAVMSGIMEGVLAEISCPETTKGVFNLISYAFCLLCLQSSNDQFIQRPFPVQSATIFSGAPLFSLSHQGPTRKPEAYEVGSHYLHLIKWPEHRKQGDILISKNQALQILYLKHHVYNETT